MNIVTQKSGKTYMMIPDFSYSTLKYEFLGRNSIQIRAKGTTPHGETKLDTTWILECHLTEIC